MKHKIKKKSTTRTGAASDCMALETHNWQKEKGGAKINSGRKTTR